MFFAIQGCSPAQSSSVILAAREMPPQHASGAAVVRQPGDATTSASISAHPRAKAEPQDAAQPASRQAEGDIPAAQQPLPSAPPQGDLDKPEAEQTEVREDASQADRPISAMEKGQAATAKPTRPSPGKVGQGDPRPPEGQPALQAQELPEQMQNRSSGWVRKDEATLQQEAADRPSSSAQMPAQVMAQNASKLSP